MEALDVQLIIILARKKKKKKNLIFMINYFSERDGKC